MQGLNGLKYFSTIVAVAMRTSFDMNKGMTWKILAMTSSIVATVVSTYWDIVIDWGLLRSDSENRWLRDKLLIPSKSVYFVAMVRIRCSELFYSHHFFDSFLRSHLILILVNSGVKCSTETCLDAVSTRISRSAIHPQNSLGCNSCLLRNNSPRHLEFLPVCFSSLQLLHSILSPIQEVSQKLKPNYNLN